MSNLTRSFEEEVIEASYEKPVLVDFWAAWCGPCRVVGPVLEKLASEQATEWTLVKVNTDEHPNLSQQFSIRGIPAIKLFSEGKVIGEFTGALPEYAIKQWLRDHLPTAAKKQLKQAQNLIEEGEIGDAILLLEGIHAEESSNAEANLMLAGLILFQDAKRASELAKSGATLGISEMQYGNAIQQLAAFIEMDWASLPEGAGQSIFAEALAALKEQNVEMTFEKVIELLQKDKLYHHEVAQKLGVALFNFLGDMHSATQRFRRTFNMWLN